MELDSGRRDQTHTSMMLNMFHKMAKVSICGACWELEVRLLSRK